MSVRDHAVEAAEINAAVAGDTLPRAFLRTVAANPGVVALRRMVGEGADGWEELTYRQLGDQVAAHSEPVSERGGVIAARCDSAVWAAELTMLAPSLCERLNGELEGARPVLEQMGVSLNPTFTCRLGKFIPITAEEAEDLKLDRTDERLKRKAIAAEPVELPPDKQETQDAGDAAADDATSAPASPEPAPAAPAKKAPPRGSGVTVR